MKSVVAAELAAITAWRVLAVGDRIGAILFNDTQMQEVPPSRNQRKLLGWLGDLAVMNNELSVTGLQKSSSSAFADALHLLERSIGHDYLVVVISDFFGWNDEALGSIKRLSQHNDIICSLIYDPLERDISRAHSLVVSDGQFQLEIDPTTHGLGDKFEASFQSSMAHVQQELKRHDILVLPVDTVEPVSHQLRVKLGGNRVL
ncbi:MAG: hypothetical protein HOC23_02435 [Halieaceae bacterium]|nr:hypothetical protein [Halieaceae bacterium]